jgi:glutathione synthase
VKILILADPIDDLNPSTDTALTLAREALIRGHQVAWTTGADLCMLDAMVFAQTYDLLSCEEKKLPERELTPRQVPVREFDTVWIRKDPPFDEGYMTVCWMLALEESHTLILNPPSLLLRYHEKMLPFEAFKEGVIKESELVPTFVPTGATVELPELYSEGPMVSKPFLGHGGEGVERWKNYADFISIRGLDHSAYQMFQPFMDSVTTRGDRRVFCLDGKVIGDLLRVPKEGDFIANLSQGGSARLTAMTAEELELSERVSRWLQSIGFFFAGFDLMAGKISEINVTAPTGFESLADLGGPQLRGKYLDDVEEKLAARLALLGR